MNIMGSDNFMAEEEMERQRQEKRSKMIKYLEKWKIKINDSMTDDDLEELYLNKLTIDSDFLSSDLIFAESDARWGEIGQFIVSLAKNTANAFSIPDISEIVKEAGLKGLFAILKTIDIAKNTSDDTFQDLNQRMDKTLVLKNLDREDSVFRIYSAYNDYLSQIPEFYSKEYPSFAKQFAMLGAMNQRPEDANLSRMYQQQFASQLDTIFNSGEYSYLHLRYKNIKDEMWWFNDKYLNESYKLSKEFVPGMIGLSTSLINGIPDINTISFLTKLMQSRNVDIDELQNMDEYIKTPGVENLKNSKKTKSSEKKSYEALNKSLEFEMQGNLSGLFDLQSNSFPSSIGSLAETITDYNDYFQDYSIEDYLKNSTDINIIPSNADNLTYLDKISMLSDDIASPENSTLGNMPFKLNYEIFATDMTGGLIQQIGEKYSDMSELVVDAVQNIQTFNEEGMSAVSGADDLERSMNEYKAETYSAEKAIDALNTAFLAMNISGINLPFKKNEEILPFSKSLHDAADACGMLASAFMNVDENIGKAIGSAGTLTEGVAGIFKAFEGDKVNGLGLMSGIQGGFAGLQGLFGGEAGSDMSELLGGLGGMGAGVEFINTEHCLIISHAYC